MPQIEIEDGDVVHFEYLIHLGNVFAKFYRESQHSDDSERKLGYLRGQAIGRIARAMDQAKRAAAIKGIMKEGPMVYQAILPEAFPWVVNLRVDEVLPWCEMLVRSKSSFAVTTDAGLARINLWISENSKNIIVQNSHSFSFTPTAELR